MRRRVISAATSVDRHVGCDGVRRRGHNLGDSLPLAANHVRFADHADDDLGIVNDR